MDNEVTAMKDMTDQQLEELMKSRYLCKFNDGVNCCTHIYCGTCGWNPAVARRRSQKLYEEGEKFVYDL